MDPDANLKEQRRIVARINGKGADLGVEAIRLAELVEALDHWIKNGGFLPKEWQR